MTATLPATDPQIATDFETLHRDGIVARRGAFDRDWVEPMREDMMTAFWSAIQRSGGTIGRGPRRWYTAHESPIARPVLILGVVRGDEAKPEEHDLALTRTYHDTLPPEVREHLLCRVVDELTLISQRHDIEGLVMGEDD